MASARRHTVHQYGKNIVWLDSDSKNMAVAFKDIHEDGYMFVGLQDLHSAMASRKHAYWETMTASYCSFTKWRTSLNIIYWLVFISTIR